MVNAAFNKRLNWLLRHTPRLGSGWRYLPLHQLPTGTRVEIQCKDAMKPLPGSDETLINGKPEKDTDVLRLSGGSYTLFIGDYPQITIEGPEDVKMDVRPLYDLLAPSSTFQANVEVENPDWENTPTNRDKPKTLTKRLTTGLITSIVIPGTRYRLTIEDGKNAESPKTGKPYRRRSHTRVPLRNRACK